MQIAKCLCIILLIFSNSCMASPLSDNLQKRLNGIRTMRANFTQTVRAANGRLLQSSQGFMAMQRPKRLHWHTKSPAKQLILADGRRLWVYDIDLKQVRQFSIPSRRRSLPALFLSDTITTLSRQFVVSKPSRYRYVLVAKKRNAEFQTIHLLFDHTRLIEMSLYDKVGQISTIRFSKIRVNKKLSPKLFKFVIPSGADMVGNRSF